MRDNRGSRAERLRPSPAMVVAVVALIAAVAGTAVALPGKRSIDRNDLKPKVVARKNLVPALRKQLVPATAQAGIAKAYARVDSNGTVLEGFGIASGNVTQPRTGIYCFNLSFNPRSVQATVEGVGNRSAFAVTPTPGRDYIINARARPDANSGSGLSLRSQNCPGAEDASVEIQDPKHEENVGGPGDGSYELDPINAAFYVEFK